MAETNPHRMPCAICGGVIDRCPIVIGRPQVSKKQSRQKPWRPNAFDKYPNQVCVRCDVRAVNKNGVPVSPRWSGRSHSEPVFIDGVKCWRVYGFGGYTYVTMRDVYDAKNITDFLDQTGVHRCDVDSLTPEDINSVTKWLPQLQNASRHAFFQASEGSHGDIIFQLMRSFSMLAGIVMERGSEFNWSEWQCVAQYYVREGDLLEAASLETCVRLLITHIRKDRFCGGHFRSMVEGGHIERLLTRLEFLRKSMLTAGRPDNH